MTSRISISLKQVVRTWRIFEFIETWQWPLELCGWRSFLICRVFAKRFGYPRLLSDAWDGIFLEEVRTCVPSHLWCSVFKYLKLLNRNCGSIYWAIFFRIQNVRDSKEFQKLYVRAQRRRRITNGDYFQFLRGAKSKYDHHKILFNSRPYWANR